MQDCRMMRACPCHSERSEKAPWLHTTTAPSTCLHSSAKQIVYTQRARVTKLRRRHLAHGDYAESQHKEAWPHRAPGSNPCSGSNNSV